MIEIICQLLQCILCALSQLFTEVFKFLIW